MMWLWVIAWTYLIFVLHTGIAQTLAIGGCAPHLVLAGLVVMTVRLSARRGVLLAAGWGLLLDCLGEGRPGVHLVALTLATLTVQEVHSRWALYSPWRLGLVASVVAGALVAATASLPVFAGVPSADLRVILVHAAGSALTTGVAAAIIAYADQMVLRPPATAAGAKGPTVLNQWRMLTDS